MPTDDPRLEQALHDAAPAVDTDGVVERVAHRRSRRRRNQRLSIGAGVLALFLVVGSVAVALTRDDDPQQLQVVSPRADFAARVITGSGPITGNAGKVVIPKRVELDRDVGLLRAPLLVGGTSLSVASDNPDGGTASHLVRIDGTHVVDVVDFKARLLSIAEGEGARWALTQNPTPSEGNRYPDSFVKRITASGEPPSEQLRGDWDPVGSIAAVGGAIWVPVRDGVVQFDTSGKYVRHVPLPDADARSVGLYGKGAAAATSGKTMVSLDPTASVTIVSTVDADRIVDVDGRTGRLLLERDGEVLLSGPGGERRLPTGFVATGFSSSPARTAVEGTVDGDPALVFLHDDGRITTVVLEHAPKDTALAWTAAKTVVAVAGGALYEITLP